MERDGANNCHINDYEQLFYNSIMGSYNIMCSVQRLVDIRNQSDCWIEGLQY